MIVKPLAKLTKPLRVILSALIVVSVAAVFSDIYSYAEYAKLPGGVVTDDTYLASDGVSGLVGLLQLGLLIALMITFLMWVHRASKNLRALSGEQLTFTPGWSVGWFFIPVANLFKPYQAVKEIWTVSHGRAAGAGAPGAAEPRDSALVGWWWAAFIVCNVFSQVAFHSSQAVTDVDSYLTSALVYAASDGADAIGLTVTLLLVGAIASAYARRIVEPSAGFVVGTAGAPGAVAIPGAGMMSQVTAVPALGGTSGMVTVGQGGAAPQAAAAAPAAWYADPSGRRELRWWDGAQWTAFVADGGDQAEDPV